MSASVLQNLAPTTCSAPRDLRRLQVLELLLRVQLAVKCEDSSAYSLTNSHYARVWATAAAFVAHQKAQRS